MFEPNVVKTLLKRLESHLIYCQFWFRMVALRAYSYMDLTINSISFRSFIFN